jgi:hypothetical protein
MAPTDTAVELATPMPNIEFEKMQGEQTSGLRQPSQLETGRLSASQLEIVSETCGRAVHLRLAGPAK